MRREIDILREAARKECTVVEKASHVVWTGEDMEEAARAGRFTDAGTLLPPDHGAVLAAPYPGCLQMGGGLNETSRYRMIGHTEHFVIFTEDAA